MALRRIHSAALLAAVLSGCSERERVDETVKRTSGELASPADSSSDPSPVLRPAPGDTRARAASPPATEQASRPPFEGTIGIVEETNGGVAATLRGLRAARHEGYDRVVFEFQGTAPGHHLEYIDKPVRACGSGDVVPIAGDGWLEVRLSPANSHDDEGRPTVSPAETAPELPNLVEIQRTCDFEAVTTYVLGVKSPNPYRVLTLTKPSRLVVDVLHGRLRR